MLSKDMFLEVIDEITKTNKEVKYDHHPEGGYIGNKNTGVYHHPDCSDILKMNEENKVSTNNDGCLYRPCAHCKPDLNATRTLRQHAKLRERAIPCEDQTLLDLFYMVGCSADGSKDGLVKMYPDNNYGVKVHGKPGKWFVYYQCRYCQVETSLIKAKRMGRVRELVRRDVHEHLQGIHSYKRNTEIKKLLASI